MNKYRQNATNHLKTHLGCVGYRDYLIAELEKLEKIEQVVNTAKAHRLTLDSQDIQAICEVLEYEG